MKFRIPLAALTAGALALSLSATPALAAEADQWFHGADRYATAISISSQNWQQSELVFIAAGHNFPDAMSAGAVAAYTHSPVLLADQNLRPDVAAEVARLHPQKIYVAGGPRAVAPQVDQQLRQAAPGAQVIRVAGADRYETSARFAELLINERASVAPGAEALPLVLASGKTYQDAIAGAAAAAYTDAALLLMSPDSPALPPSVTAVVSQHPGSTMLAANSYLNKAPVEEFFRLGGATPAEIAACSTAPSYDYSRTIPENTYPCVKYDTLPGSLTMAMAHLTMIRGAAPVYRAIYVTYNDYPDALAAIPLMTHYLGESAIMTYGGTSCAPDGSFIYTYWPDYGRPNATFIGGSKVMNPQIIDPLKPCVS